MNHGWNGGKRSLEKNKKYPSLSATPMVRHHADPLDNETTTKMFSSSLEPPQPPSSPELSYTRLVKLTPAFRNNASDVGSSIDEGDGVGQQAKFSGLPLAASTSSAPTPFVTMTSEAQHPPEGTTLIDKSKHSIESSNLGVGMARPVTPSVTFRNSQTLRPMPVMAPRMPTHNHNPIPLYMNKVPNSHPPHSVDLQLQQRQQHAWTHQNSNDNDVANDYRSTPVEQRVANLALKLQAMETNVMSSSSSNPLHPHTLNQKLSQESRFNEIHQFVETLKSMHLVVSRTTDEQQRLKKSRALNALLNMFESIIEERRRRDWCPMDPSTQLALEEWEQRVQILQRENDELRYLWNENGEKLHQLDQELHRAQQEIQHLSNENELLKNELSHAQELCHQEKRRAQQAESIASESEQVRNDLLCNYGRITEENVELERAMEEMNSQKHQLERDLEYCRDEVTAMQNLCHQLNQRMQEKDTDVMDLERKLKAVNAQLQVANADRQRLQEELHASHRNSTSTSRQLLELRDRCAQLQRDTDSKRRNQLVQESEHSDLRILLQQEQERRIRLEGMVSKSQARETAGQEQIRKLARTNAELKTKVNELNARLSSPLVASLVTKSGICKGSSSGVCASGLVSESAYPMSHVTSQQSSTNMLLNDELKTEDFQPNLVDY